MFRLLGRVEAERGGRAVPLGRKRERCLLALLLLEPHTVVGTQRLLDLLWDDAAGESAKTQLHSHVSRLRKALAGDESVRLVARDGGYSAEVDPQSVDAHRFRALVTDARMLRDPAERSALLREALALWRGPVLADVASDRLRDRVAAELTELRLVATELAVEADLDLARHEEVIGELLAFTVEHPLRERPVGQLMLALCRSGRQADALQHYQQLRERLADELGSDPSPPLQRLHEKILRGEIVPPQAGPRPGRNDLPRDVTDFTGRADELRLLHALDSDATAVVIDAIDGMAGVGKTALAVHLAHRLVDRYPDAQLFIDLHGHSDDRDATPAGAALEALLRALGVPAKNIPDDVDERSALWRAELAARRVLVVLDNAWDSAQVQPLLPGAAGCLALVTSRRRLVDLPTTRTVSLDVLPLNDAVALFTSIVGEERAAAETGAVEEVVRGCGCLPLAVRLAAARLRSRPQWTVEHFARRLAEFSTGDLGVAAAFDLSYRDLTGEQQRMFRVLGLHPGDDFDVPAAAALAGLAPGAAEHLLEDLVDVHLLQPSAPGRYRCHDLLRQHARTLAGEAERHEALARLVDHYLRAADVADALIAPPGRFQAGAAAPAAPPPIELADAGEAVAWFDTERVALLATTRISAAEGRTGPCWQLAAKLHRYLHRQGWTEDLRQISEVALARTVQDGDRRGEAVIRTNLGLALYRAGEFAAAREHLLLALPLFRALGDLRGESQATAALGNACKKLGRFDEALVCFERDLAICQQQHNRHGEAIASGNLGAFCLDSGRYTEARSYFLHTLEVMRETGDRLGESTTLGNLGELHRELGDLPQALRWLEEALALCRELTDRHGEARTLTCTGEVYGRLNRIEEALDHHHRAWALIEEIGSHSLEAPALNGMARSLWHCGKTGEALVQFDHALRLARSAENKLEEAAALEGIGQCLQQQGNRTGAARSWQLSHEILTGLHHPRAEVVGARLAGTAASARSKI
jgi:DNA-binding SARP family transcriptional activator